MVSFTFLKFCFFSELSPYAPKTKNMHTKGKYSPPDEFTSIKVNGVQIENVGDFNYLGAIKSSDGTCQKFAWPSKNVAVKQHMETPKHS